jgi:hypothetical protein
LTDPLLAWNMLTAIPTSRLKFPEDRHLRYRFCSAPGPRDLHVYLISDDDLLQLNARKLGIPEIIDIQAAYLQGNFYLHFLTRGNELYSAMIPRRHLSRYGCLVPRPINKNISALTSVIAGQDLKVIHASDNGGLYVCGTAVPQTAHLHINEIILDSESPQLLLRTVEGDVYILPTNNHYSVANYPIWIDDIRLMSTEETFTGPTIQSYGFPAILAVDRHRTAGNDVAISSRKLTLPFDLWIAPAAEQYAGDTCPENRHVRFSE